MLGQQGSGSQRAFAATFQNCMGVGNTAGAGVGWGIQLQGAVSQSQCLDNLQVILFSLQMEDLKKNMQYILYLLLYSSLPFF